MAVVRPLRAVRPVPGAASRVSAVPYDVVDMEEARALAARIMTTPPLFDFEALDGVRHTVWVAGTAGTALIVEAFAGAPALYIADGHHRAASAARARAALRGSADADFFLAVAFPSDQV